MPKGRFAVDLVGNKFNKLTVLVREPNRITNTGRPVAQWLCKCDCGNLKTISGPRLKNGRTKSCGCLQKETRKENWVKTREARERIISNLKIEPKNKLPAGQSGFNKLYNSYKKVALAAGREFSLSKSQFKQLTSANCYYCNAEPSKISKAKTDHGRYIYNGVDRKNSSEGYALANSVSCCTTCNLAKRSLTDSEFIQHAVKIAKHFENKEKES